MIQKFPKSVWGATQRDGKTGDIPTAYIGETRDESKESCSGCPLLEKVCYAQNGAVAFAHGSMTKKHVRLGDKAKLFYSFEEALRKRCFTAKYVRMSAIGDGARANPQEVRAAHDQARSAGLGWLAYTHFHDEVVAAGTQDLFCASASSFEEADAAIAKGFKRAAVVAPLEVLDENKKIWTTPDGNKAFICPAIGAHAKGRRVTCNQCGMCDPSRPGPTVVMFPEHGKSAQKKLHKYAKEGKEWAKNLLVKL